MQALIVVDLQSDFLPGGALAVHEGDHVLPVANKLCEVFDLVVATQDWHPPGHGSFAANHPGRHLGEVVDLAGLRQVLWPVHCVAGTSGAELAAALRTGRIAKVFFKGTDPTIDSYSGFFDNGRRKATGLGDWLKARKVTEVYILGLATDYCVKYTALDALSLGFRTKLVLDGCRGVNLKPGDVERAIAEMSRAGIEIVTSDEVVRQRNTETMAAAAQESPVPLYVGKYIQLVRRGHWEYVERTKVTGVVGIVAITPQNRLILVEQYRVPLGKRVLELPAGLAGDIAGEEQEEMASAARRELLEETGYQAGSMKHLITGPSSAGLTNETMSLFMAENLVRVGAGGGDASEDIEVHEVPLDEAPLWLRSRAAEGIMIDTKIYAALYFAAAK